MSSSASAFAACARPMTAIAAMAMPDSTLLIVSSNYHSLFELLATRIHVGEFGDATAEFLRGREFRVEIGRDQVLGEPGTDDLRADAHDVDVVVLDALMRGMHVVADRGADALHLVGADRGADAGAADHQAALGLARRDRRRDLARDVGKVDRRRIVGADIEYLVAALAQEGEQLGLHGKARMVGADNDLHGGDSVRAADWCGRGRRAA